MSKEINGVSLPPQNLEAEMAILGAILIDDKAIKIAKGMIGVGDLYRISNREIFTAMIELSIVNKPADLLNVKNRLISKKLLEAVGGVSYLEQLVDFIAHTQDLEKNCEKVLDASGRRLMASLCSELITDLYNPEVSLEASVAKFIKGIYGRS